MKRRPDFLMIGAGKAGTSSLRDLMAQHPEIHMVTDPKEPGFFARPERWSRGWAWYDSLFDDADGAPAAGEGSPAYSDLDRFPDAPARIAEHLPHVKLIYTVRHPVRRAESHWIHLRTFHSPTAKTTRHALETYPEIIGCSRYFRQISAYRENFPDDRIHVVFLEDFKADPDRELRRIFGFLGVAEGVPLDSPGMARNVATNGKVVDTPLLMKLRTLKAHRMLRRLLPLRCREMLRTKFFRRKLSERPEFDAEDARYVRDRVAEDAAHFLEYCGKRAGFWELEKQ